MTQSSAPSILHRTRPLTLPAPSGSQNHQVLVLDISYSMDELCEPQLTKIDALKKAAIPLLGIQCRQNTGSRVTIVVFADKARVLIDAVADPEGHPQLVQAINSIASEGGTDIVEALEVGSRNFDPDHFGTKQLTLLSDGGHGYGGDPLNTADGIRQRGISIAAIGFGNDADENLLKGIASQSKGVPAYWHARDQQTLSRSLVAATRTL